MKKGIIRIGIGLFIVCILALTVVHFKIRQSVKENIEIAKQQYPGTAEEALIAFLQDENKSTNEKTHLAIWTLGQIRSQKALPILQELYQNDPKGKTCYGKHHSMLCQYEIHKAIITIEKGIFAHPGLNK
jgi:hypothetical protein